MWNANHILWAEQVRLLWIVLPPIFAFAALAVLAAPLIAGKRTKPLDERAASERRGSEPSL